MTKAPKFKSRRYVKSIKESINALFKNKKTVHKQVAEIIGRFSHNTTIKKGDSLMDSKLQFFVVENVLSSHFLRGFFCPGRIFHTGSHYWYEPNPHVRGETIIKRLNAPFSNQPYIKVRKRRYYFREIKKHEAMQYFNGITF